MIAVSLVPVWEIYQDHYVLYYNTAGAFVRTFTELLK